MPAHGEITLRNGPRLGTDGERESGQGVVCSASEYDQAASTSPCPARYWSRCGYDLAAEFERPHSHGRGEGVIEYQRRVRLTGCGGDAVGVRKRGARGLVMDFFFSNHHPRRACLGDGGLQRGR